MTRHHPDPQRFTDLYGVGDVEDAAGRKHAAPMRHQPLVALVVAAELGEIVSLRLVAGEQQGKARKTSVDRVAPRMDDPRVRQRQVDQTGK